MTKLKAAFISIGMILSATTSVLADRMVIDDFTKNPAERWRFVADTVMGGVSSGKLTFERENGVDYARMTGDVSTANNGGFIQFRTEFELKVPEGIQGIRLIARGNNQRYFVHLRTSGTILPWQYYQAAFDIKEQWAEYRLPLSSFKRSGRMLRQTPKGSSLTSVGIVAYGRDHRADIKIREIGFY